ncbi:DUF4097 family beta strand repeat-containing protein [Dyella sp.]|jgi:hypothetical protein|uniref:DUF4097 family beta strand repeat-containing protein n=1 Tax=Dyella sp. TaxID=1869338 RepID=UPI002D78E76C|nr:DUF4097 family beta strand repeat-containing protein [Dyella sp.]HET6430782.1 DUF4097 family beta strand repeat-containing protein [Dyella sp.]
MKPARFLPLAALLYAGLANADTPLDLTHPATAHGHVSISNIKGEVTVTAWDRNEVHVSGRLGDGARPLNITGPDDALEIKVQAQGKSGFFNWGSDNAMGPTTLNVQVPRGTSLDVDVVSAPLVVDGLDGGAVSVNSVSGRIRINAQTPSLEVDSVSGSIEQAGHARTASLQTVSGDILAPGLGDEAELETVSGQIQVRGGPWRTFTLSTVSGDIDVSGGPTDGGKLTIDSMSGDVQLMLPGELSGTIHASSFSGDLRSDFGKPERNEHGPGSELNATQGNGAARIAIESFSGDVRIRSRGK